MTNIYTDTCTDLASAGVTIVLHTNYPPKTGIIFPVTDRDMFIRGSDVFFRYNSVALTGHRKRSTSFGTRWAIEGIENGSKIMSGV